jgi:flagellar basal-body rod protein FlgF
MDRLIYTAHMAMAEQRLDRQALTHELANVTTVGFKRAYEVANRSVRVEGDGFDTRFLPRAVTTNIVNMSPGPQMVTGRALDVSMNDLTVLGVFSKDNQLTWTRRGDLKIDPDGFLRTGEGYLVSDDKGKPISMPLGSFNFNITNDGEILAMDPAFPANGETSISKLNIKDTTGIDLVRRSDGLFQPVKGIDGTNDFETGPGIASVNSRVLEGSNVNTVTTLVKFIDHSRSFEMQTRVIKEMKDNDSSGESMMRLS